MHLPIGLFRTFIMDSMIAGLVDQTNLYATRKTNACIALELTQHEMNWFLGVQMLMSIVKLSAMRMHWEFTIQYTPIAEAMSHDKFLRIRRCSHIHDDNLAVLSGCAGHDRLHKIGSMYDKLKKHLKSIPPEERQSVEKHIIQIVLERQASFMGCKSINQCM